MCKFPAQFALPAPSTLLQCTVIEISRRVQRAQNGASNRSKPTAWKLFIFFFFYHYRTQWCELIVECTSLLNVASLEGQLKTAASHAETHGVHVNVIVLRGFFARAVVAELLQIFFEWFRDVLVSVNLKKKKKIR